MHIQTAYQILPLGTEKMQLQCCGSGQARVTAERNDNQWTITAQGQPPITTDTRAEAIDAMTSMAVDCPPHEGQFSTTTIPHGLRNLP